MEVYLRRGRCAGLSGGGVGGCGARLTGRWLSGGGVGGCGARLAGRWLTDGGVTAAGRGWRAGG